MTVKMVSLTGTTNGFRIKSWARPSSGFVKGVLFQRPIMRNVQNPIITDQNYSPPDCPNKVTSITLAL